MKRLDTLAAAIVAVGLLTACGGGGSIPSGSVVNDPGGGDPPPTKLVNVKVTVTIPSGERAHGVRPDYVSVNTRSLVIALTSANGGGVSGVNPTTIETDARARDCKSQGGERVCTASASGAPGNDVFAVTTYEGSNATGAVLSVGTVQAKIGSGGGGVPISDRLSLTLDGVVASIKLVLQPNGAKRGSPAKSAVTLAAYDASGAEIVGASRFVSPISLTIQGDVGNAFLLHHGSAAGASLSIVRPASNIVLSYNGDSQASPVSVAASIAGPSGIGASENFALRGRRPPPPVGTIYALNLGTAGGKGATVTEYDGKANGNAQPLRTLALSSKLYARSIAVDANENLYVGYTDNAFGFSPSSGLPDRGNEIAIYAPDASGDAQPSSVLTADTKTNTTIFPIFQSFDSAGNLVTYGATSVDENLGNDAVLTYSPGASGAAAPSSAWAYYSPTLYYGGPTGLVLDTSGNFYVNAALHSSLGPSYGLFVTPSSENGNPAVTPSRTIPWDGTTQLAPGETTNVVLDPSGEVVIGNSQSEGSGSAITCQGRANVFSAGTDGGTTDEKPLRVLTFQTVTTTNPECESSRSPLEPYFPAITLYGTSFFVADDFNNAIDAYPSNADGTVKPTIRIAGAATALNAPVMLVVTSTSGRARSRSAHPR